MPLHASARLQPGESFPFTRLDPYKFQDLCRDLFETEKPITTCYVYGTYGQTQYGIDLLSLRHDGGIEVGQCKRYTDFPPTRIRKATDDFWPYVDYWLERGLKRFILFVACDMSKTAQAEEILAQRARFAAHGVEYEVWAASTITNKLRTQPGLVATYCEPAEVWQPRICGSPLVVVPLPQASELPLSFVTLTNEHYQLAAQYSKEMEHNLDDLLEAWREGRGREVKQKLAQIVNQQTTWATLESGSKARVLVLQAAVELDLTGDVTQAKVLADKAKEFAPGYNDARIRAQIAYRTEGFDQALALLQDRDDVDSLNLKAALLLEAGRLPECSAVIDSEPLVTGANAETFRLRSLLHLTQSEVGLAQLEIQKALARAPKWRSVRLIDAMAGYFGILSPAVLPGYLPAWPMPADWAFLKADDESVAKLRRAADGFGELTEETNDKLDEKRTLAIWRLACLASDLERQEDASAFCEAVLRVDPLDYRALFWALARGFPIDLGLPIQKLMDLITAGNASLAQIVAVVDYYLISHDADTALCILDNNRPQFHDAQSQQLWLFKRAQALALSGATDQALLISDSLTRPEERQAATMATMATMASIGSDGADWSRAAAYLESQYTETKAPAVLFEWCEVMAQQRDWAFVAEQADALVSGLQTVAAVRLVSGAAFNVRRFDLCLELLDRNLNLFPRHKLPSDLRRLRVLSQQALGTISQAVQEAEALTHEDPSVENLIALVEICFQKGDLRRLLLVAQRMAGHPDLNGALALRLARLAHIDDPDLAVTLWRKALDLGLPDELWGDAVLLGLQLGVGDDLRGLMQKAVDLGNRGIGGLHAGRIEDMVAQQKSHFEQTRELERRYVQGTLPIHMFLEYMNRPMITLYHDWLLDRESRPDPASQPMLLARHGARFTVADLVAGKRTEWRVHMDVTAILLAAHLDILKQVETLFKPLRIPPHTQQALLAMREQLMHDFQPPEVEAQRQIVDLVTRQQLVVVDAKLTPSASSERTIADLGVEWANQYAAARVIDGYIVDFLPLVRLSQEGHEHHVSADGYRRLISCRDVVETLYQNHLVDQVGYQRALTVLASGYVGERARTVTPGSDLFFAPTVASTFARAGILELLCDHFAIHISEQTVERAHAYFRGFKHAGEIAQWLSNLIERIARGIDAGTYEMITASLAEENGPDDALIRPESACLLELFKFEAQVGDVLWIDDRYANSFLHREGAPIIGINEILKALLKIGSLKRSSYYGALAKLRAANVRFIPIEADEILYYLQSAKVQQDTVVENRGLRLIRQYLAGCLLRGEILQHPSVEDGTTVREGELPFVLGITRSILDAIVNLWNTGGITERTRRARAEWLLTNLYLDHLGVALQTGWRRSEQDDAYLIGIGLAGLASRSIVLSSDTSAKAVLRKGYLTWLAQRIVGPHADRDPQLIASAAEILKPMLLNGLESGVALAKRAEPNEDVRRAVAVRILRQFYQDLPDALRNELWRDREFMARIGLTPVRAITLDGLTFEREELLIAAAAALDKGSASLQSRDPEREVTIHCRTADGKVNAFCFINPVSGREICVDSDLWSLLSASPDERSAILRRHREWFDCSPAALEAEVSRIAALEDPLARVTEAEYWQESSAAQYYADLYDKVRGRQKVPVAEFAPEKPDCLLRFCRLSPDAPETTEFTESLERAAQELVDGEGILVAITRLVAFPMPLPRSLLEAVDKLSAAEVHDLVKRLLTLAPSPVSRAHFVHLLVHIGRSSPQYLRLAKSVAARCLGEEAKIELQSFTAVLDWTHEEYIRRCYAQSWSSQMALAGAWSHAHQIFTICRASGLPASWVREFFAGLLIKPSIGLFNRKWSCWYDIAHPRQLHHATFVISALRYGLGDQAESLNSEILKEALTADLLFEQNGQHLPELALLADPSLADDALGSFLAGDRSLKLTALYGTAPFLFTDQQLHEIARNTVRGLKDDPHSMLSWSQLLWMLGGQQPYADLREDLKALLKSTNFRELLKADRHLGLVAIQAGTAQSGPLGDDELANWLRENLLAIARTLEYEIVNTPPRLRRRSHNANMDASVSLLESALNLALCHKESDQVAGAFGDLVVQLVEANPHLRVICQPIIQRLYEELPLSLSKLFAQSLLHLRSKA